MVLVSILVYCREIVTLISYKLIVLYQEIISCLDTIFKMDAVEWPNPSMRRMEGIMVGVFIKTNIQSKMMNTTTRIPCGRIS